MSSVARVTIHASQFPDQVRADLLASLRAREVNHKFHYDSVKQTQKWLALHQACSPTRNDANCVAMYGKSFAVAAAKIQSANVCVVGLGCGGGQKDARLLEVLSLAGTQTSYAPCDVATAMVLVARQAALAAIPTERCLPFVFDLASAEDLREMLKQSLPAAPRIFTFFGMIPNFEPQFILPKLASLIRHGDYLLLSANLAPGKDYSAGVRKILPQYDNVQTKEWLLTFLFDLGVERADGELRFEIEIDVNDLQRVVGKFYFSRPCRIAIESEIFDFDTGSVLRLFFSYRHTPLSISTALISHGLLMNGRWLTQSEEEGVFLCHRAPGSYSNVLSR